MTLGKVMAPFHVVAELRQKQRKQSLDVTNINRKTGPPGRQIGLPQDSSFL